MKVYLLGNLPFFKIHVNHFVAGDNSPGGCQGYPKIHVVDEGPGAILFSFETFPFSN